MSGSTPATSTPPSSPDEGRRLAKRLGGYVKGDDEVRDYWTWQWAEIDGTVTVKGFSAQPDGRIDVTVRQRVKNLDGELLEDATVHHIYRLRRGQVAHMEIRRSRAAHKPIAHPPSPARVGCRPPSGTGARRRSPCSLLPQQRQPA